MNKIKIVFLLGTLGIGGTERQFLETIRRINRHRFDLHVLSLPCVGKLREEIEDILDLGEPFDSAFSMQLHTALKIRAKRHFWNLLGASLVDQAVAVGIAGGVFLYSVNHWAATGEIPWYLTFPGFQ